MADNREMKFTPTNFDTMYNGSWFTIEGAGGDIWDWVDGLTEILQAENIGKPQAWMTFKGKEMNDTYHLTGTNAYPDDLTFLAFSLNGLDIGLLAVFKLEHGARWFDDIVDNNARRENDNA